MVTATRSLVESAVEFGGDVVEVGLAHAGESCALREVLAQPPVRVLLGAALPGRARVRTPGKLQNGRVAYNRSAPPVSVTPVLTYPNVTEAVAWLVRVFGFDERVRIGDHRAQLSFGNGALIVADDSGDRRSPTGTGVTHSVMVRVDDIDKHYAEVQAAGVTTLSEPADMSYGERQYSVMDPAGHRWTFTQSVMDVVPEDWGGLTIQPW